MALILAIGAFVFMACVDTPTESRITKEGTRILILDKYYKERSMDNPHLVIIDSCEYIVYGNGLAHKGNCKFCNERKNQELIDIYD